MPEMGRVGVQVPDSANWGFFGGVVGRPGGGAFYEVDVSEVLLGI